MASQWIKIEHTTPDKPEVFQIADMLGIDPDAVVGKLVRVWIWADQQTRDGNAPSVTSALLDRISCVTGFADALQSVGWLDITTGGIHFCNFDRHNGNSCKTRALSAKRVETHREVKRKCNGDSVTKALPEKRRESQQGIRETDSAANHRLRAGDWKHGRRKELLGLLRKQRLAGWSQPNEGLAGNSEAVAITKSSGEWEWRNATTHNVTASRERKRKCLQLNPGRDCCQRRLRQAG